MLSRRNFVGAAAGAVAGLLTFALPKEKEAANKIRDLPEPPKEESSRLVEMMDLGKPLHEEMKKQQDDARAYHMGIDWAAEESQQLSVSLARGQWAHAMKVVGTHDKGLLMVNDWGVDDKCYAWDIRDNSYEPVELP